MYSLTIREWKREINMEENNKLYLQFDKLIQKKMKAFYYSSLILFIISSCCTVMETVWVCDDSSETI